MIEKNKFSEENIQTLEFYDHIRNRPGMYLGQVNHKGFIETFKKFITQFLKVSAADNVGILFKDDKEGGIIFSNIKNPFRQDIAIFNYSNLYSTMDLPILNSLSEVMNLNFNTELVQSQRFQKGKSINKISNTQINSNDLIINFKLDEEIWGHDFKWNSNYLTYDLTEYFYLNSNVKFEINFINEKQSKSNIYKFDNGLSDRLDLEIYNGHGTCYFKHYFNQRIENFIVEVAFAFRQYSIDQTFIKTYVNNEHTPEHGSHLIGVLNGINRAIKKYLQNQMLDNAKKFKDLSLKKRLVCIINIRIDEPAFYGSTKMKLANPEIIKPITNFIATELYKSLSNNPETTNKTLSNFN